MKTCAAATPTGTARASTVPRKVFSFSPPRRFGFAPLVGGPPRPRGTSRGGRGIRRGKGRGRGGGPRRTRRPTLRCSPPSPQEPHDHGGEEPGEAPAAGVGCWHSPARSEERRVGKEGRSRW